MLPEIKVALITNSVTLQQFVAAQVNFSCVLLRTHVEFGLLLFGQILPSKPTIIGSGLNENSQR